MGDSFATWDPEKDKDFKKLRLLWLDDSVEETINTRDAQGQTAAIRAIRYINKHPDFNIKDEWFGFFLVQSDLSIPDNNGKTAYDYLTETSYNMDFGYGYPMGDLIAKKTGKPRGVHHLFSKQARDLRSLISTSKDTFQDRTPTALNSDLVGNIASYLTNETGPLQVQASKLATKSGKSGVEVRKETQRGNPGAGDGSGGRRKRKHRSTRKRYTKYRA